MEELQIPYNLVNHERIKSGKDAFRAPPELKKTHPLGKAPQLIAPDGRVITESSAIAKYLIDKYDTAGRFKGGGKNDVIRDEELVSFSSTNLNSNLLTELLFTSMADRSPFFVRPFVSGIHSLLRKAFLGPEMTAQLTYLNEQLGEQDYYMGSSPGRADFVLSWPIDTATQWGFVDLKDYPMLKAWHERCKARDGWQRGIEKGNGYKLRP